MTGKEIIEMVFKEEENTIIPDKDPRQPRVSMVWACPRRQVGIALGLVKNKIPWYYCEAGYVLQEQAFKRIKKKYPDAEQEVCVPTSSNDVFTHPDIFIPELNYCIQVKSGAESSSAFGIVKANHRDQVLLEWYFWILAGFCYNEDKTVKINQVPSGYEIMYTGREGYGKVLVSIPVTYNANRASYLAQRFEMVAEHMAIGVLPDRLPKQNYECRECDLKTTCWE